MKETIEFYDLTQFKHKAPAILGVLLCMVFGILLITHQALPIYIIGTLIGLILLAVPQIININKRNTIKYNNTGLTAKLLGFKTFGFQFTDLDNHQLTSDALILTINNTDVITLSRKRFNDQSLQQLHTLIQSKTNNYE